MGRGNDRGRHWKRERPTEKECERERAGEGNTYSTDPSAVLVTPLPPPKSQHPSDVTAHSNASAWVTSACWFDSAVLRFSCSLSWFCVDSHLRASHSLTTYAS